MTKTQIVAKPQIFEKKRIRLTIDERTAFLLEAQAQLLAKICGHQFTAGGVVVALVKNCKLAQWIQMRRDQKEGVSV
jgi:hypothetical protein